MANNKIMDGFVDDVTSFKDIHDKLSLFVLIIGAYNIGVYNIVGNKSFLNDHLYRLFMYLGFLYIFIYIVSLIKNKIKFFDYYNFTKLTGIDKWLRLTQLLLVLVILILYILFLIGILNLTPWILIFDQAFKLLIVLASIFALLQLLLAYKIKKGQ